MGRNPPRNSIINFPPSGPFLVTCHCFPSRSLIVSFVRSDFCLFFIAFYRTFQLSYSVCGREKIKKATGLTFRLSIWHSFASSGWKSWTSKTSWSRCDRRQPWRNVTCKASQRVSRSHKPWQNKHWPSTPCTPDRATKVGDQENWVWSSNQGQQQVTTR